MSNFTEFLFEKVKIKLKPFKANYFQDFNRDGEILLKDENNRLYRSYHNGKLHNWKKDVYDVYRVIDPNNVYAEEKVGDETSYEIEY